MVTSTIRFKSRVIDTDIRADPVSALDFVSYLIDSPFWMCQFGLMLA